MTSHLQHVQNRVSPVLSCPSTVGVIVFPLQLKAERDASQGRANIAGAQLIEVAKELEESRKALDTFRRETFQSLSSGRNPVNSDPSASSDFQAESNSGTAELVATGPFLPPDYPPPISSQTSPVTPPPHWGSREFLHQ